MLKIKEKSFAAAARSLPRFVARTHRGRSPREGFDCLGMTLWFYRMAGDSIDHLDVPYALKDQTSPRMWARVESIVRANFSECTEESKARRDVDGDLWLFRDARGGVGMGVYVDGELYVMYDRLVRRRADEYRLKIRSTHRRSSPCLTVESV